MRLKDMTPEAREAWRAETAQRYPDLVALMKGFGALDAYLVVDDRGAVGTDDDLITKRDAEFERGVTPTCAAPLVSKYKKRDRGAWR